MKFDAGNRTRILVDLVMDLDPTGSTVELRIDNTWYPATWLGSPVQATPVYPATVGKWTQTARSNAYFAGPDANQSGATPVAAGRHPMEVRITSGQDVLTDNLSALVVS